MEALLMVRRAVLVLALVACSAAMGRASSLSDPVAAGFEPRVPISALARPAAARIDEAARPLPFDVRGKHARRAKERSVGTHGHGSRRRGGA